MIIKTGPEIQEPNRIRRNVIKRRGHGIKIIEFAVNTANIIQSRRVIPNQIQLPTDFPRLASDLELLFLNKFVVKSFAISPTIFIAESEVSRPDTSCPDVSK